MSEPAKRPPIGTFGWFDLTVDDAPRVRDFYREVVGWSPEDVPIDASQRWRRRGGISAVILEELARAALAAIGPAVQRRLLPCRRRCPAAWC